VLLRIPISFQEFFEERGVYPRVFSKECATSILSAGYKTHEIESAEVVLIHGFGGGLRNSRMVSAWKFFGSSWKPPCEVLDVSVRDALSGDAVFYESECTTSMDSKRVAASTISG
jgi:hypothetical protein